QLFLGPPPGALRTAVPGRFPRVQPRTLPPCPRLRLPPAGAASPFRRAPGSAPAAGGGLRRCPAAGSRRRGRGGPAAAGAGSGARRRGGLPARRTRRLADEPLGPRHAAAGGVRAGRAPGPDCRLDLEHHLVLSFRAFVDDLQVSNWRGLTGGYPSRLFVLPLAQVVDEYTRIELRGLRSVPLRLGPDQVARLLERAARVHW